VRFDSPWQLLIATILSAQTTDAIINSLIPRLFRRFPGPRELAEAELAELENLCRSSGAYRQKSKRIRATARVIVAQHDGVVPSSMDQLLKLPGVARKTANVVLSIGFKSPQGIIIDTHMLRVCCRTGISAYSDPIKMEIELIEKLPRNQWGVFENRIKEHGQKICLGRKPLCGSCFLTDICPKNSYVRK
jgi:endonuclease-3